MFRLDNRTFLAEVNNIEARVARMKTALEQAKNESERGLRLLKRNAISAEAAEARMSITAQREAEMAALSASLRAAKLNLEFTQIKAPISSKVSYAEVTEGNTVRANDTKLTNIISTALLYAYFDIDERTWNENFSIATEILNIPVKLDLLGRETNADVIGTLDFIDNSINENTGTLKVRAKFNNINNRLLPGAFARVSLSPNSSADKIIIPDRAIGTDLKNRFVLIVDDSNTLQYRQVITGKRYGEYRAITMGLDEGERIAVNGPAKVGHGMPISPRVVTIRLPKSLIGIDLAGFQSSVRGNVIQGKLQ